MIRCTIELIPFGIEEKAKKLGIVEIGNDGTGNKSKGNYKVVLKKTSPFNGMLKQNWRAITIDELKEDEHIIVGEVEGFDRVKRGVYDLLYRALKACGLDKRNK